MVLHSYGMLLPCGVDKFHGTEYVCCPSLTPAAPAPALDSQEAEEDEQAVEDEDEEAEEEQVVEEEQEDGEDEEEEEEDEEVAPTEAEPEEDDADDRCVARGA